MSSEHKFRWFAEDSCDGCGECFIECPVLSLSETAAKADIAALIEGNVERSAAFRFCTTCNVCDFVCPKGADPYELILERFDERTRERGLPSFAKLVFPNEPENVWSGVRLLMGARELSLLKAWEENLRVPRERILLTGFYTNLVPFLAQGKILDSLLPVAAGSEGLWGCGGDTNKLGAVGLTEQVVKLCQRTFSDLGVQELICFMPAEAAMLGEVLPRRYGGNFSFEVRSLDDWILERLESGVIEVNHPLGLRVTVHDNCMSRYFGGRPQEILRKIASRAGCDLVEMEHNRFRALCCGWAATIPTLHWAGRGSPFPTLIYLLSSLQRRMEEAARTGADVILTSCPACYLFLTLIREVTGVGPKVLHTLDLVGMAAGETPVRSVERRAWDVLAVATNLIMKWALSAEERKRFFPRPPDPARLDPVLETPEADAGRIRNLARFFNGPLVQNPVARRMIGAFSRLGIAVYRGSSRGKMT